MHRAHPPVCCRYHELYKLAARDGFTTLQRQQWTELYHALDADASGMLTRDEVSSRLESLGASDDDVSDILKALFAKRRDESVDVDTFVKRAQRMRAPLQLDLLSGARLAGTRACSDGA